MANEIVVRQGDNLSILREIKANSVRLIYIDPPYNTGKEQARGENRYSDKYDDFQSFIEPRLQQCHRILTSDGSLFVHLDWREVHYVKVWLDQIFGRASFINEIVWVYDYGARSKTKWSTKHDNILWYAKDPKRYIFNYSEIERIPYMAPGLVGKDKAERGKTLTDSWWHTIVGTNSQEKTGYPTQKPLGILSRIVKVHSEMYDTVLDCFAGSGSFGEAAYQEGRNAILIDQNSQAIEIMRERFKGKNVRFQS
jgi:site-specific DNA-methyltransferase (adenine-specific)